MKKKTVKTITAKKAAGYGQLVTSISAINTQMVRRVATVANQALVLRNWLVGAYIVEFEQKGAGRAKYGARLLETLAEDLKAKGVKGLGAEVLRTCRLFRLSYPQISHTVGGKFEMAGFDPVISHPVGGKLGLAPGNEDFATSGCEIRGPLDPEFPTPLEPAQLARISWAHFLERDRAEIQAHARNKD